jgi:hypothetical protein
MVQALRHRASWRLLRVRLPVFVLLVLLIAWVTPREQFFHAPFALAQRLLTGHVSFDERVTSWEMYARDGRYFICYAPMASVVLMPFAAIVARPEVGQPIANSFLLLAATALLWRVLRSQRSTRRWADIAAIAYLLGTPLFYSATVGNVWLLIHTEGNLFLLAGLRAWQKRRFAWFGAFVATAIACRFALVFALPGLCLLLWRGPFTRRAGSRFLRRLRKACVGAAVPTLVAFILTALMTGNPLVSTYSLAYREWGTPPLYSIERLAENARFYFLRLPERTQTPPYMNFPPAGQAFWAISPFFLLLLLARLRERLPRASAIAAIGAFVPYLFFIWNGYAQYGSRYVTDLFPFLFPLAFSAAGRFRRLPANLIPTILVAAAFVINGVAIWLKLQGRLKDL